MTKENEQTKMKGGKKTDIEFIAQIAIIAILVLMITISAGKIDGISGNAVATGIGTVSASEIIPNGTPAGYGNEMGINYDDVSPNNPKIADATIFKLRSCEAFTLINI